MKDIKGKDARIYRYVFDVLNAISDYYRYDYVKQPLIMEDNKRIAYNTDFVYNFMITGNANTFDDAEFISMFYRILEELRIEDVEVKINYHKSYDIKVLCSYLDELDVNYEYEENDKVTELFEFKVITGINNKEVALAEGFKDNLGEKSLKGAFDIDKILDYLSIIYEDRDFTSLAQVTIIGESTEERIKGMKLAQDLRWCEIKVDFDSKKSREEQLENIKSNLSVLLNEQDLKKGLIKVIDNLTKEESLVDEAEIIDYIISNI